MTRMNMDLLKTMVFGPNATHDHRFVWAEITPDNIDKQPDKIQEKLTGYTIVRDAFGTRWVDFRKYRISECAHYFRIEGVCSTCGDGEQL